METTDPECIAKMEMPCVCNCGEAFDLNEGNACDDCNKVMCETCCKEPFGICVHCQED